MRLVFINILAVLVVTQVFAAEQVVPGDIYVVSSISKNGVAIEGDNIHGELILDRKQQDLSVYVFQVPACAPKMLCPLYLIDILSVSAPITQVQTQTCATTYKAELDERPVDGALTKIEFTNYDSGKCMFLVAPVPQAKVTRTYYSPTPQSSGPVEDTYELSF